MAQTFKRQVFPTITQAFLNRARSQPEQLVFFTKQGPSWVGLSWKDYFENVRSLSLGLMELGLRPGENVCLISNTRLEWAACDMAILGAKGVTVPVYASNTADETAYVIDHCDARLAFVEDQKQLEKVLSVRHKLPKLEKIIAFSLAASPALAQEKDVLSLSALRELGHRHREPSAFERNLMDAKPSDVFTICYTSGTTGVPKGAILTFDCLTSVLEDVDKALGKEIGEADSTVAFLPLSHILGRVESMAGYHFGWQVYYAESIEKLMSNMGEVHPTILFAVPRIFEKAYNRIMAGVHESSALKRELFNRSLAAGRAYYGKIWAGQRPSIGEAAAYALAKKVVFNKIRARFGGKIRFCIAGGAPLPREIGEFMRIVGILVLEGYGLTETCAPIAVNVPATAKFGSIGKPMAEVSLKINDDGEMLVKSRKVFREYYKDVTATKEAIDADGWFHTGDIGIIDEDGFVMITDRKKDLIVTSGGKNVAPQKIENMAKTFKFISQFMVHGDKRNFLSALVVLEKEEVVKHAKEHNILFSEYGELIKNPKIQALVQKIIDDLNSSLASYETVKKFKILPHEFSIESGELTPSLKVRRRFCNEKYKKELDSLYEEPTASAANLP